MQIRCNLCSAQFESTLTVKPDGHGGEIQEFTCPVCAKRYPVATITAKGVKLRAKLAELREQPGKERQVRRTLEAYRREVRRLTE